MSPKRSCSRRASIVSSSKPYTKAATPDAILTSSTRIAQSQIAQHDPVGKPGFPTRAQYKHIETTYLNSLTSRRREKALISQSTFDRIWDVLQNRNDSPEDGQFKFWVRRNFTLGSLNKAIPDPGIFSRVIPATQTVLLHEGSLVALQEQLYDLLCFAHGTVNHGGRDKTLTALRKYYTWVPKEIVAQFTISCPTCRMRKAGLPKRRPASIKDDACNPNECHIPALLPNVAAQENDDIGSSKNVHETILMLAGDRILDHRTTKDTSTKDAPSSSSGLPSGPRSLPMSREVSLYHGLPNGWQFHTDYATAHAEFMKRKNEGTLNPPDAELGKTRPRIPSVAPLIGPDYVPRHDDDSDEDLCTSTLPSVMGRSSYAGDSNELEALSPTLQSPPAQSVESCPIDPILLGMASSNNLPSTSQSSPRAHDGKTMQTAPGQPSPQDEHDSDNNLLHRISRVHRAAALPVLNLAPLNSLEAIEAFLARRNARNTSPYSPLSQAPLDSPACSIDSSCSSQLSVFPMIATNCSSAATSALPTPVDDVRGVGLNERGMGTDQLGKELEDELEGMTSSVSGVSVQAVYHEVV